MLSFQFICLAVIIANIIFDDIDWSSSEIAAQFSRGKTINQYFGYPGNIEQIVQARGFYCWRRLDAGRNIGWIGRRAKI